MTFLAEAECRQWWTDRTSLNPTLHSDKSAPSYFILGLESPAPRLYAIARQLVNWAAPTPPTDMLIWVRETQNWYGGENLHLYYTWRRSHANHDTVEARPGHLLHFFEVEDAITIIHMSLLFGWGISFAADFFERGFHIDHDTHGRLLAHEDVDIEAERTKLGLSSTLSERRPG